MPFERGRSASSTVVVAQSYVHGSRFVVDYCSNGVAFSPIFFSVEWVQMYWVNSNEVVDIYPAQH